jgi:hypothetical protein
LWGNKVTFAFQDSNDLVSLGLVHAASPWHSCRSTPEDLMATSLYFQRVAFVSCPTGLVCREDRCQSFFKFELVPSLRPPMEDCEGAGGVRAVGADALIIDAPAMKLTAELLQRQIIAAL